MRIDQDSWEDWLGSPITEAFFRFCRVQAEEQKARWLAISWDGGQSDPLVLARLQERAITLEEVTNISKEDVEE